MLEKQLINPATMITHIGGLNSMINTTLNLPNITGGGKLIYTNIKLELTSITEFKEKGKLNPLFAKLYEILTNNNGLWCYEAEKYLLEMAEVI